LLWSFVVAGLPQPEQEREAKLKLVAEGIEAIKGVTRVESDVARAGVRVEFDPQVASRTRIKHEVEFRGFQVVEPATA
jgi:copper chaperone CopZ